MLIEPPEPVAWPEPCPTSIVWPEMDLPPPVVQADAALVLPEDASAEVFVQPQLVETLMLPAGAEQGPPGANGPAQIYNQASAPAPIAGYILLWFQSGVSADPDDREINLVVSP